MNAKLLGLALLLCVSTALAADEDGYVSVPPIPTDNGFAVENLVYARAFELDEPYIYMWSADHPSVKRGMLLVVEVDPEYAKPLQVGVPVLYAGTRPVELTNVAYESGRMVVIVPEVLDLTRTPIYFGSTELPERVDAARGELEQAAAIDMGIAPFSQEVVQGALETGGDTLFTSDLDFLFLEVSNLILTYSPGEVERAELYRLAVERH